jgi:hypothetical protein
VSVWTKTGTRDEVREWAARVNAPAGSQLSVREIRPGVVEATVRSSAVATRAPGRTRQGVQPARWSVRRRVAVATAVAVPALSAAGWLVYEVWVYRYVILGVLVVAAVLAVATRGGRRGVIALFENGGVRWFDER